MTPFGFRLESARNPLGLLARAYAGARAGARVPTRPDPTNYFIPFSNYGTARERKTEKGREDGVVE